MSRCRTSALAAFAVFIVAGPAWSQGVAEVGVAQLDDVDPFVVGALTPQEGGLASDLWQGSDPAGVEAAAQRVVGESGFLAAAELAAKVLMSAGAGPEGAGDPRAAATERARALLELGRVDAVDSIVSSTSRGFDEPELAALAVSARLAENQIAPACRVGEALTEGRDGAFWLRLRAACYAWSGETAAAQITLDLAREADADVADENFTTWVHAAASRSAPDDAPPPRDALESALAQSAGYAFDAESLERLPLLVAVGLAHDVEAPADVRAQAALRASRSGAVSADEYAAALDAMPAPEDALVSDLIEAAQEEARPQADALLRRAAEARDGGPYIAAQAISAALGRAETPADFIVIARTLAEPLAALPPSPDLAEAAPDFVLAAAAVGDQRLARAWLDPRSGVLEEPSGFETALAFGGSTVRFDAEPDYSQSPLEPVARIAAEAVAVAADARVSARRLASVAHARLSSAQDADIAVQASARRDVLILLALGAVNDPELRRAATAAVSEAPPVGDIAAQSLAASRLAAQAGAIGEAVLYAAEAAAEAGPAHAPTVATVIEVLRAVGREEDARALAVEAMLASRLGEAAL